MKEMDDAGIHSTDFLRKGQLENAGCDSHCGGITMDVREKLVEILRKPIFPHELVDPIEAVADYLLDSGATVQEWISGNDRLPDELPHSAVVWSDLVRPSACVLAIRKNKEMEVAWYSYANGWWTTPDEMFSFQGVTHWMPLPEPPNGE